MAASCCAPTGEGNGPCRIAKGRQKTTLLDLDDAGRVALLPEHDLPLFGLRRVGGRSGYIVYRGQLAASGEAVDDLAPGSASSRSMAMPFDSIGERDIVAMLRRYVHERSRTGLASRWTPLMADGLP